MKKQLNWLFKPANINALDYQEELTQLTEHIIPDFNGTFSKTMFNPVESDTLRKYCPKLVSKLTEWGLGDRIAESALISVAPGAHYAIHRDFPIWKIRTAALNIPVLNCKGSYTAFYEAEVLDKDLYGPLGQSVYTKHSHQVNEETAKEIGRCPSEIPHWLNVFQPHAPVVEHDKFRIAFSTRFHPELFDYFENGTFESLMVKHD